MPLGQLTYGNAIRAHMSSASGGGVLVLDVGANNGKWSRGLMENVFGARRSPAQSRVRLVMLEPQPRFRDVLRGVAEDFNAIHYQAAAWHREANLSLHIGPNSETASLVRDGVAAASNVRPRRSDPPPRELSVAAIDLAQLLQREIDQVGAGALSILKLDVEGAEYEVLPSLLQSGALCAVDYLRVEWHLNALPPQHRLAGLGLQHSLEWLLHHCPRDGGRPPPHVTYDLWPPNNDQQIPGLWQELVARNETLRQRKAAGSRRRRMR
jgi:FkbM family methyltransferase